MCYQNIENAQVNRFKQKNGKKHVKMVSLKSFLRHL